MKIETGQSDGADQQPPRVIGSKPRRPMKEWYEERKKAEKEKKQAEEREENLINYQDVVEAADSKEEAEKVFDYPRPEKAAEEVDTQINYQEVVAAAESRQEALTAAEVEEVKQELEDKGQTATSQAILSLRSDPELLKTLTPEQLVLLNSPQAAEVIYAEIKSSPSWTSRLSGLFTNKYSKAIGVAVAGAGLGLTAKTLARKALVTLAPGYGHAIAAAAGGIGAGTTSLIREWNRTRKLEKAGGVTAKVSEYIDLVAESKKGKGGLAENLARQEKIKNLAVEIQAESLEGLKGADKVRRFFEINAGAAQEAESKEAAKLHKFMRSTYSGSTNWRKVLGATALGALGGLVGSVAADALSQYWGGGEVAAEAARLASENKEEAESTGKLITHIGRVGASKLEDLTGKVKLSGTGDVLPMHGSVWRTAKEFLIQHGLEHDTDAVNDAVESLTEKNGVSVVGWGQTGKLLDTGMIEGHPLQGFHDILRSAGREVVETDQVVEVNMGMMGQRPEDLTDTELYGLPDQLPEDKSWDVQAMQAGRSVGNGLATAAKWTGLGLLGAAVLAGGAFGVYKGAQAFKNRRKNTGLEDSHAENIDDQEKKKSSRDVFQKPNPEFDKIAILEQEITERHQELMQLAGVPMVGDAAEFNGQSLQNQKNILDALIGWFKKLGLQDRAKLTKLALGATAAAGAGVLLVKSFQELLADPETYLNTAYQEAVAPAGKPEGSPPPAETITEPLQTPIEVEEPSAPEAKVVPPVGSTAPTEALTTPETEVNGPETSEDLNIELTEIGPEAGKKRVQKLFDANSARLGLDRSTPVEVTKVFTGWGMADADRAKAVNSLAEFLRTQNFTKDQWEQIKKVEIGSPRRDTKLEPGTVRFNRETLRRPDAVAAMSGIMRRFFEKLGTGTNGAEQAEKVLEEEVDSEPEIPVDTQTVKTAAGEVTVTSRTTPRSPKDDLGPNTTRLNTTPFKKKEIDEDDPRYEGLAFDGDTLYGQEIIPTAITFFEGLQSLKGTKGVAKNPRLNSWLTSPSFAELENVYGNMTSQEGVSVGDIGLIQKGLQDLEAAIQDDILEKGSLSDVEVRLQLGKIGASGLATVGQVETNLLTLEGQKRIDPASSKRLRDANNALRTQLQSFMNNINRTSKVEGKKTGPRTEVEPKESPVLEQFKTNAGFVNQEVSADLKRLDEALSSVDSKRAWADLMQYLNKNPFFVNGKRPLYAGQVADFDLSDVGTTLAKNPAVFKILGSAISNLETLEDLYKNLPQDEQDKLRAEKDRLDDIIAGLVVVRTNYLRSTEQ